MFFGFLFTVVILLSIFFVLIMLLTVVPYWIFLEIMEKRNPGYMERRANKKKGVIH